MIEIKKVKGEQYDSCNSCYTINKKKPKKLFQVIVHHTPRQSTTIQLCKDCLTDLTVTAEAVLAIDSRK